MKGVLPEIGRCPPPAELEKLLAEPEGSHVRADLEAHLGNCTSCQQVLLHLSGESTLNLQAGKNRSSSDRDPEPPPAFLGQLRDTIRRGISSSYRDSVTLPARNGADGSKPGIPGYAILDKLGHGGTAVVYLARHIPLQRLVALKVILAGKHAPPDRLARFNFEAESVARLQHPNIVQVFEIGAADGLPYLSLEYVAGGSLAQRIRGTPQDPRQAARLVEALARAIHYAHEHGIMHRDLKPANILLQADEGKSDGSLDSFKPKIADFGLARRLKDDDERLTETGSLLGTPRYMAPEQARPSGPNQQLGPAVDIYALGTILYEMLTGNPPFDAATPMDTLLLVIHQEPLSPRNQRAGIPRDLETIVIKCLQKDPRSRYATALHLAEDLERFLSGQPIQARPIGAGERMWRWTRRHPAIAVLLATVFVVTLFAMIAISLALVEARSAQQNETAQRREAEKAHALTKEALNQSERSLYFSNIAQARSQYLLNNIRASKQLLQRCPPEQRGWEWHYLNNLHSADLLMIEDNGGSFVGGVAYSSHGKWLAVGAGSPFAGSEQGVVQVYDSTTGELLWRKKGHRFQVNAVAFSPNGKRLASAGGKWYPAAPGEICIWDASTGELLQTLEGHEARVTDVAFSSDNARLASAGADNTARVWNCNDGKEAIRVQHESTVYSVAFSPNGRFLISGGQDSTRLTDAVTGKPWATLTKVTSPVAISRDGKKLASADNSTIKIWDLSDLLERKLPPETQKLAIPLLQSFAGHTGPVSALCFSPDSQLLASGGADGTARVWHLADESETTIYRGHEGRIATIAFHPKGHVLASGGQQPGDVKLWDLTRPVEYFVPINFGGEKADITAIAFARDANQLTALAAGSPLRSWNRGTGKTVDGKILDCSNAWLVPSETAAFAMAGQRLISVTKSDAAVLKVFDLETGGEITALRRHRAKIWHVAADTRGLRVVSTGWAREPKLFSELIIWDADTGQAPYSETATDRVTTALAVSRDGHWLADASQIVHADGQSSAVLRLRSLANPEITRQIAASGHLVRAVAFDNEGTRLAAAFDSGHVMVWETQTGAPLYSKPLEAAEIIESLAFSPDGQRLAGAGRERVQLWDVASGQDLLYLRGAPLRWQDNGFNPRITWSSDGRILAASNWNRTVSIWEASEPPARHR